MMYVIRTVLYICLLVSSRKFVLSDSLQGAVHEFQCNSLFVTQLIELFSHELLVELQYHVVTFVILLLCFAAH
jgi:hypothetical protein